MGLRLPTTPLGYGFLAGGLCVGGVTAMTTLQDGTLASGLVTGLVVGTVIGAFSGLDMRRQLGDVLAMSPPDREAVVRTVREGGPVTDARLAPAMATYAGTLRRQRGTAWDNPAAARLVYVFVALVCAYLAVVNAQEGEIGDAVVGGLVAAAWAAMVFFGPWQQQRRRQRLERVERSAQELLATGDSAD